MQHIVKRIKAVTKKYETKSGEKKSISKRVDIGVTDLFETGECVVVISKTNFDKLNNDSGEVTAKLENEVAAKDKIIATIPTLHGYHVITRPFDLLSFSRLKPEIVVHKNNPTLLYYYGTDS